MTPKPFVMMPLFAAILLRSLDHHHRHEPDLPVEDGPHGVMSGSTDVVVTSSTTASAVMVVSNDWVLINPKV